MHRFRIHVVLILIFIAVQGWTGDAVNLFASYPAVVSIHSFSGYISAITSVGDMTPLLVWHEIEAVIILVLSIMVLMMSARTASRAARIMALVGFLSVVSAIVGGLLFVFSGFMDGGGSAQMGGSFIIAFASYFLVLYFSK